MGELLERWAGTSFGLVPDDGDPKHLPPPETLVKIAFLAGAESVLKMLSRRASREFPAAIPALEALLVEVEEVADNTASAWDLRPANVCPDP